MQIKIALNKFLSRLKELLLIALNEVLSEFGERVFEHVKTCFPELIYFCYFCRRCTIIRKCEKKKRKGFVDRFRTVVLGKEDFT